MAWNKLTIYHTRNGLDNTSATLAQATTININVSAGKQDRETPTAAETKGNRLLEKVTFWLRLEILNLFYREPFDSSTN